SWAGFSPLCEECQMTEVETRSPFLAGIDRAIEQIEQQVREQQQAEQAAPGASRGGYGAPAPAPAAPPPGGGGAPAPQPINPAQSLEEMTVFLSRLKQIRDWMQQDNRLLPVVDEFIGQKVAASAKRSNQLNLTLAAVTTVVGAILGWLLSAVQS